MFAVEQSWTETSSLNKVRAYPLPSSVIGPSSLVDNCPDLFPLMTVNGAGD